MDRFTPDTLVAYRSPHRSIWMGFDQLKEAWVAEVFIRRVGCVFHLDASFPEGRPTLEQLEISALAAGTCSARPYQLSMDFDGSQTACVLALFAHLCRTQDRDPERLFTESQGRLICTTWDWEVIQAQADWEGVLYPEHWMQEEIHLLAEQIRQIGCPTLAERIVQLSI
jgi:hypothetical protein